MKNVAALLLILSACATAAPPPPPPAPAPSPAPVVRNDIAAKTAKMQKLDGFLPLFWDADAGKLYMQIARPGEEVIHVTGMAAGVGSTPIGLDRGEMGESRLVRFDRAGPKVLLVQLNERYRALSNDESERRGVEDSFAKSVLWGFNVEASEGDAVLVDATDFFLSDQHGVADRLRGAKQGSYALDRNRSAIFLPHTKAFPRNTDVRDARAAGARHQQRRAGAGARDRARAPVVHRPAAARLHAAAPGPAHRRLRHRVCRLRVAVHRAAGEALDLAASAGEKRCERGHLRPRRADRLLRRPRRPRADPQRHRRGRVVVEPGL